MCFDDDCAYVWLDHGHDVTKSNTHAIALHCTLSLCDTTHNNPQTHGKERKNDAHVYVYVCPYMRALSLLLASLLADRTGSGARSSVERTQHILHQETCVHFVHEDVDRDKGVKGLDIRVRKHVFARHA